MGNFGALTDSTVVRAERELARTASSRKATSTPRPETNSEIKTTESIAVSSQATAQVEDARKEGAPAPASTTAGGVKTAPAPDPRLSKSLEERASGATEDGTTVLERGEGLRRGQESRAVRELQDMMLRYDAKTIADDLRAVYPGRTEDQYLDLALDGKYGPAVARSVGNMRQKLGMSAEGGVTRDFLQKLDAALQAPVQGKGAAVTESHLPDGSTVSPTGRETLVSNDPVRIDLSQAVVNVERCIAHGKTKADKKEDQQTLAQVLAGVRSQYGDAAVTEVIRQVDDRYAASHSEPLNIVQRIAASFGRRDKQTAQEAEAAAAILYTGRYEEGAVAAAVQLQRRIHDGRGSGSLEPFVTEGNTLTSAGVAYVEFFGGQWREDFERRKGRTVLGNEVEYFKYAIREAKEAQREHEAQYR